jgi:hypothetical protein
VTKLQLGYVIYGVLALVGVVVPSVLAYFFRQDVPFPTLFRTVALLRRRARWVAVVIVAGLTVLAVHLALYPWPDVPRR